MIDIIHLLWVIPLSMLAGVGLAAMLIAGKIRNEEAPEEPDEKKGE